MRPAHRTHGVLLAVFVGASSLHAQQPQPVGAQQASPAPAEVVVKGRLDGQAAAQRVGTGEWLAGGVAAVFVGGPLGMAALWVAAGGSNVAVPTGRRLEMAEESPAYQFSYELGYAEKLRAKRRASALKGSLLGAAGLFFIYYTVSQSSFVES